MLSKCNKLYLMYNLFVLLYEVMGSLWAADGLFDPDITAMNGGQSVRHPTKQPGSWSAYHCVFPSMTWIFSHHVLVDAIFIGITLNVGVMSNDFYRRI